MSIDEDCVLCGRGEWSHHDFARRFKECKCDWDGADEYLRICASFGADKFGRCANCEHDEECHATEVKP